jgi:tRNA threonylcarbamoyladenosine biosynthesis protein TsaE
MTEPPILAILRDESETVALGSTLSSALVPGAVVFLEGDLGAGKTTLTRGVLRALGHEGACKEPDLYLVRTLHTQG